PGVIGCGDSQTDGVHFAEDFAEVRERPRPVRPGNFGGSLGPDIDNGRQLHAFQFTVEPRVLPAQMSDANDGHSHGCVSHSTATMAIAAASAPRSRSPRSIISVFRASIANAVTPKRIMASMVRAPMTGTSNRRS